MSFDFVSTEEIIQMARRRLHQPLPKPRPLARHDARR